MKFSDYLKEEITDEMLDHYKRRMNKHISLVQKYCNKMSELPEMNGIIEKGLEHDKSKFKEPEYTPYIYIAWRYKCKDDGKKFVAPEGMEEQMIKATEHHILNNRHHPEFHNDKKENLINKENRDAIPDEMIDATKMPALDIGEMVADFCAMSEEKKTNTPREWADSVINKRWKFTDEQKNLIYKLIDYCWEK